MLLNYMYILLHCALPGPGWEDRGCNECMFAASVESQCGCGFSSMVITSPVFRCFPESSIAVTFRATLTDSRLLTPIQDWIQTNGFITIQSVLNEVDKTCQVQISSLADTECNNVPVNDESSAAVIGGVVGGVVIVLIIRCDWWSGGRSGYCAHQLLLPLQS